MGSLIAQEGGAKSMESEHLRIMQELCDKTANSPAKWLRRLKQVRNIDARVGIGEKMEGCEENTLTELRRAINWQS
jgi:hypothetical protein